MITVGITTYNEERCIAKAINSVLTQIYKEDEVIVVYPHEVEWYQSHGLDVDFIAYPHYEKLNTYFPASKLKKNQITIFFGSRNSEIDTTLPIFTQVIKQFQDTYHKSFFSPKDDPFPNLNKQMIILQKKKDKGKTPFFFPLKARIFYLKAQKKKIL